MSVIAIYLIFSMLAVIISDVTRYIIPNWLVGLMLLAYPVAVYMAPGHVEWRMAILGMGAVLAVGFIISSMKWMGAGDIKLLTVCALWVGWGDKLMDFIFTVAIFGGILAVALWSIRKILPFLPKLFQAKTWPRILREGEPAPYGVAIALAFLLMLWGGGIAASGWTPHPHLHAGQSAAPAGARSGN